MSHRETLTALVDAKASGRALTEDAPGVALRRSTC